MVFLNNKSILCDPPPPPPTYTKKKKQKYMESGQVKIQKYVESGQVNLLPGGLFPNIENEPADKK